MVGDVTTSWATAASASTSERPASGTATFAIPSTLSVSNKPMVPTAHTWPDGNPIDQMRRHMGRPLDSVQRSEQRRANRTTVAGVDERMVRPVSGFTWPHYRFVMARTGRAGTQ